MKTSDVMLFINSFTANAGTLPKWQKNTRRQDSVRCPHLPAQWHQEAPQPPPSSTPDPMEMQMPVPEGTCSISQDPLFVCVKIQDPRAELRLAEIKVTPPAARVGECQAGWLCCPDPLHCLCCWPTAQNGDSNQNVFKRWRGFRCCPRHTVCSLRSAYIHFHVKLPAGALQPPGHLLHVQ